MPVSQPRDPKEVDTKLERFFHDLAPCLFALFPCNAISTLLNILFEVLVELRAPARTARTEQKNWNIQLA
jgi:hypothetical protein